MGSLRDQQTIFHSNRYPVLISEYNKSAAFIQTRLFVYIPGDVNWVHNCWIFKVQEYNALTTHINDLIVVIQVLVTVLCICTWPWLVTPLYHFMASHSRVWLLATKNRQFYASGAIFINITWSIFVLLWLPDYRPSLSLWLNGRGPWSYAS